MADRLASRSALAGVMNPGRRGRQNGAPGVTIGERVDVGLATVMVRKGRQAELRDAVQAAYAVLLPETSSWMAGPTVGFIGTGPGHWLAVSEALPNGELAADLSRRLKGLASIVDQSDGRAVIRISGPRARDVLAKGLPIDLHPRAFAPGSAATSVISLMGVTLWRVDEAPTYDIAVFRSLAGSFWGWLSDSAAEYGFEVAPAPG